MLRNLIARDPDEFYDLYNLGLYDISSLYNISNLEATENLISYQERETPHRETPIDRLEKIILKSKDLSDIL